MHRKCNPLSLIFNYLCVPAWLRLGTLFLCELPGSVFISLIKGYSQFVSVGEETRMAALWNVNLKKKKKVLWECSSHCVRIVEWILSAEATDCREGTCPTWFSHLPLWEYSWRLDIPKNFGFIKHNIGIKLLSHWWQVSLTVFVGLPSYCENVEGHNYVKA